MMIKRIQILLLTIFLLLTFQTSQTNQLKLYSSESTCCVGMRGNIDSDPDDLVDISDLLYLADYMFYPGSPAPICMEEANVNGDENDIPDISDLLFLVDYMFSQPGEAEAPADCPSLIQITNLEYGDNVVYGTADVPDTVNYKVVLWAKTNLWYIQPTSSDPFTFIQNSGNWSNSTNPWVRMVALLVDTTYQPGTIQEEHPSSAAGVLDYDEFPEKLPDRYINWSNYNWRVKKSDLAGPGPNAFSDSTSNVWVDENERMHLKITYYSAKWQCSEIVLDSSYGYGTYKYQLDSRVDSLDYNTIFAGFVYDTTAQEFDFEFSQRLAAPYNAQYVVQPYYNPGNIIFYNMIESPQTSHSVEWRSDRIVFKSWNGYADLPTAETLIYTWTYTGADIPTPLTERFRFNIYLYGGEAPVSLIGDEVIVKSFKYEN